MPVTMDAWKGKRKEWTTARDAAHVKKGAVTSVSIGDRLDKVYAASGKGYQPLLAALAALEKDLNTYQAKGGKSVAGAKGYLTALTADLHALQGAVKKDMGTLKELAAKRRALHEAAVPPQPSMQLFERTETAIQQEKHKSQKTLTWLGAAKVSGLYNSLPRAAKLWGEFIKYLGGVNFAVTLPNKKAEYDALADLKRQYAACYQLLLNFTKIKTKSDHLDCMKAAEVPMNELDGKTGEFIKTAAVSLLG
jgi:hypothetical protein